MSGGDEDLAELVVVEPTEFVAARNAKAKALRASGEKDRAAVVAKLRKPSWTAWALNVLARDEPDAVAAFLAAGDALDEALGSAPGGDREALRAAQQAERAALADIVERGAATLGGAGRSLSDQDRQRLTGTLRAAVTDAAARDLLVRGVLVDDVEAPGFGFGFGTAPAADAEVVDLDSARAKRAARAGGASKEAGGRGGATKRAAADEDDDERAAREAAEREAAEEAAAEEARRVEAERLAAERARLDAELQDRRAELEARDAEVVAAEEALAAAREAASTAQAAVDDAAAARDALPEP